MLKIIFWYSWICFCLKNLFYFSSFPTFCQSLSNSYCAAVWNQWLAIKLVCMHKNKEVCPSWGVYIYNCFTYLHTNYHYNSWIPKS